MNMDLQFHLSRQTGGLTRAIDRGTKYVYTRAFVPTSRLTLQNLFLRGIAFLIQAVIFRIVPTALEISLVCGLLVCTVQLLHILITFLILGRHTNLAGTLQLSPCSPWPHTRGLQLKPHHGGMSENY